jgi:nucleotide-binding universal stress UspA family protein
MDVFTAASHGDVLNLSLQVALLLLAARALGELAQRLGEGVAITLLTSAPEGERGGSWIPGRDERAVYQLFTNKDLSRRVVEGNLTNAVDVLLGFVQKDYDLITLGASERSSGSDMVFNPIVAQVMRLARCPTMIVKAKEAATHWPPKSILLPTNGSAASRHAAEIASTPARNTPVRVKLLNVVGANRSYHYDTEAAHERRFKNAHRIVDSLRQLGESQEVSAEGKVRTGGSTAQVSLEVAQRHAFDLLGYRPAPRLRTPLFRTGRGSDFGWCALSGYRLQRLVIRARHRLQPENFCIAE